MRFFLGLIKVVLVLVVLGVVFWGVQKWRIPELNPEYEKLLYADQAPVWEDNLYFAMQALTAPENIDDIHQYGLDSLVENLKYVENRKAELGIPYSYKVPEKSGLYDSFSSELTVKDENWENLTCLYKVVPDQGKECASESDVQAYIADNKVLWDRFHTLPDYKNYWYPSDFLSMIKGQDLIVLTQLKAAQIVGMVEKGQGDAAFQELLKFMSMVKMQLNARTGLVLKAIYLVQWKIFNSALEKMFFLDPSMASKYEGSVREILAMGDNPFRARFMLSDDLGGLEMAIPIHLSEVNALRNETYKCLLAYQDFADVLHDRFPYGQELEPICPLQRYAEEPYQGIMYAFLMPGFFKTNTVYMLAMGGYFKGIELAPNIKRQEIYVQMVFVGMRILAQKVSASGVLEFLQSMPQENYNPITHKPFDWDDEKKALYFMAGDQKVEFRLNVK